MSRIPEILYAVWATTAQMAPWLLFGFFIAGLLFVLIPPSWVERHLGGRGPLSVFKSALFGVPLPLCSCGVIPMASSLRSHGASRGAVTAFLISTPQTGVDSILATWGLLGPVFAIFRPVVALLTGLMGGFLVDVFDKEGNAVQGRSKASMGQNDSPGGTKGISKALRYGFLTLPADIGRPLIFGIIAAGLLSVFADPGTLAPWLGSGLSAKLVLMAIGIPLYVCSTASIPLAVAFMHLGASPGAVFVFLVAGPATNMAAVSVIWHSLGCRATMIYLLTVAVGSVAAGYAMDGACSWLGPAGMPLTQRSHDCGELGPLGHAAGIALVAVLAVSMWPRRRKGPCCSAGLKPELPAALTNAEKGAFCPHCKPGKKP